MEVIFFFTSEISFFLCVTKMENNAAVTLQFEEFAVKIYVVF